MSTTRLICTTVMIAACVYDVIALQFWGVDGSISHWFAALNDYPVPVFTCGFLSGHFIAGRMKPVKPAGDR